jgi:hypothetical protein
MVRGYCYVETVAVSHLSVTTRRMSPLSDCRASVWPLRVRYRRLPAWLARTGRRSVFRLGVAAALLLLRSRSIGGAVTLYEDGARRR